MIRLILVSLWLAATTLYAGNDTFNELGGQESIRNRIYFKTVGTTAYVMSPASYLRDEDPRKQQAMEKVFEHFRELAVEWAKFAARFSEIDDKELNEILANPSADQATRLFRLFADRKQASAMEKFVVKYTGLPLLSQRQATSFLLRYGPFGSKESQSLQQLSVEAQLDLLLEKMLQARESFQWTAIKRRFPEPETLDSIVQQTNNSDEQKRLLRDYYERHKPADVASNELDRILAAGDMVDQGRALMRYLMQLQQQGELGWHLTNNVGGLDILQMRQLVEAIDWRRDRLQEIANASDARAMAEKKEILEGREDRFFAYFDQERRSDKELFGDDVLPHRNEIDFQQKARQKINQTRGQALSQNQQQSVLELSHQMENEYNKQVAYLLSKTIDYRKIFEQSHALLSSQSVPDNVKHLLEKSGSLLNYAPETYWININGDFIAQFFMGLVKELGNDKSKRSAQALQKIDALSDGSKQSLLRKIFLTNPYLRGFGGVLGKIFNARLIRIAILVRPWAITELNLQTNERRSYIKNEYASNLIFSVNASKDTMVRDANFLRVSVGGIYGNFQNLSDFSGNWMFGASSNLGPVNVKAGVLLPRVGSDSYEKFSASSNIDTWPDGFGLYFLMGGQAGAKYPQSSTKTVDADGVDLADPKNTPIRWVKDRSSNHLDVSVTANLTQALANVGADYGALSEDLRKLLGIKTPAAPAPAQPGLPPGARPINNFPIVISPAPNPPNAAVEPGGPMSFSWKPVDMPVSAELEKFLAQNQAMAEQLYQQCMQQKSFDEASQRRYSIDMHLTGHSDLCFPETLEALQRMLP